MITSIANSLGFGSGLDMPKLVADLAAASREPKVARFEARARTVQASISAVAQARSDLDGFASSLSALIAGGSLQSQPVVSDATLLDAKPRAGAQLGNFAGEIEILQLARGQMSASGLFASSAAPVGQGTLTITVGTVATDVVIGATNDSLDGLAAAINASGSGIAANVITDPQGARIVLKGTTGAASAFTLSGSASAFTMVQTAQDARFRIDGLNYTRGSNTVDDAVPGLSLTLKKAAPGTTVSVGVTRSAEPLETTLDDFVSVYNTLKSDLATARGATRNDSTLRTLDQQLSRLLTQAVSSGSPASLSAIGIKTNRDGTIALDEIAFRAAWASNPDGVEAIFMPTRDSLHTAATDPGIGGALDALKTAASGGSGPLASLTGRLGKESAAITKDRETMEAREATYKARLERQFAGLDGRIGTLKATQSYLDQQIKAWNGSK
jgi:flagellar hook-associated protein 2